MTSVPTGKGPIIAQVVFSPVSVFEMAVACEVFGIDRSDMGVPRYDVRLVAGSPAPLTSEVGFTIGNVDGLRTLRRAHTIIIPGWPSPTHDVPPADVLDELRRAHRRGARIVSFCSGAFVLAAAGLLDGRRATTHWMYGAELARRHPAVQLDPSVLYVNDGNVWTAAGTSAAIDLCLQLLRADHGAEVANVVARRMVVPPHRDGGQAQYVEAPMVTSCGDETLANTLEWATRHLDQEHTVESLARLAQQSPRTFARRFRAATGTTPLQWLLAQRVVLAQRLLETTDLSIDHVAGSCGFTNAAALREHFVRRVGVTPQSYRLTFRRRAG